MKASSQSDRQQTLLLVEDDELVRDTMTRLFVREGYLVLTAPTGHDAIGLLRTPSTPIDLVLLDVGLPDVSGTNLCARLRQLFPNLPVVVCSGAITLEEADELRQLGITHFFSKPVAMTALIAAVRSALQESSPCATPNRN
jgi:DNA-binding response OmpR family regulator